MFLLIISWHEILPPTLGCLHFANIVPVLEEIFHRFIASISYVRTTISQHWRFNAYTVKPS